MLRTKLKIHVKTIHDAIHGFIPLSYFAIKIIDTPYFQRLREIKQLGTCCYVFPTATHTRFEHSIGTYYVASEQLNTIVSKTNPEDIDDYLSKIPELKEYYDEKYNGDVHVLDEHVCELIKIAALCHDIGHGPFSHTFDDYFIKSTNKKNEFGANHEERSGILIDIIIKSDNEISDIISDNEIQFIKNLINPKPEHSGFIYQIISNSLNGLDVDKFDYLLRDSYFLNFQSKIDISRLVNHIKIIDNNIVYPEQALDDIYNLLHTRYRLHKQVYCHKVVISIQYIIIEMLLLLDDILNISDSILDMHKFCTITDSYIFNSISILDNLRDTLSAENIEKLLKAKKLAEDITNRNLYCIVYSVSSKKMLKHIKITCEEQFKDPNLLIHHGKIGFVSGNKPNPFDNIYVYQTKDSTKILNLENNKAKIESYKKNKDVFTLLSNNYQEYHLIFYYKDKKKNELIKKLAFEIETAVNLLLLS